jgi:hypothetical protein
MKQIEAYHLAFEEANRLRRGNDQATLLIVITRPRILQICARFCREVFDKRDISPFLDRIMEDLARPDHDVGEISFKRGAPSGKRF